MIRARAASIVAYAASCGFLILAAGEFDRHGGFAAARTIVSHSGLSPHDSEDAWLLLEHAAQVLPKGARVVFLNPAKPNNDFIFLAVAIAQLPQQQPKPPSNLADNPAPDYVITFHETFSDPRYELIDTQPAGFIYRRR